MGEDTSMAPEQEPTSQKRKFLGVEGHEFTKLIFGCFLGIVGTLALTWWTSKSPHLKVIVPETVIFQGDKDRFGLVNFTVINDGSKKADNVECTMTLESTTIQDAKITPTALNSKADIKGDTVKFGVHHLN